MKRTCNQAISCNQCEYVRYYGIDDEGGAWIGDMYCMKDKFCKDCLGYEKPRCMLHNKFTIRHNVCEDWRPKKLDVMKAEAQKPKEIPHVSKYKKRKWRKT